MGWIYYGAIDNWYDTIKLWKSLQFLVVNETLANLGTVTNVTANSSNKFLVLTVHPKSLYFHLLAERWMLIPEVRREEFLEEEALSLDLG